MFHPNSNHNLVPFLNSLQKKTPLGIVIPPSVNIEPFPPHLPSGVPAQTHTTFLEKEKRIIHALTFPRHTTHIHTSPNTIMKDRHGWDGKLRVGGAAAAGDEQQQPPKEAIITNPEALEDPDYSDSDAPPVEEIQADEGALSRLSHLFRAHPPTLVDPFRLALWGFQSS